MVDISVIVICSIQHRHRQWSFLQMYRVPVSTAWIRGICATKNAQQ